MTAFEADELGRAWFGPLNELPVLGEGGSAIVYGAELAGQPIALKVLRPEVELEDRELRRFVEEAGRMRRVHHPALVPLLDVGILRDGRPYIAMPRLDGEPLSARLAEVGRLRPDDAFLLFEALAAGASALHEAGLVHRDIKPENVLWLRAEQRLVLLDLGIAREADATPSTTTRAGMMRGTPAYMAPERFFGKPASVSTDVYELALLFFIMVVGRLPWEPDDPRGRLHPRTAAELGVELPAALSSTLSDALAVDHERRPRSVPALVAKLRQALVPTASEWRASSPQTPAAHSPVAVLTPPRASADFSQAPTELYSPQQAFAAPTLPSHLEGGRVVLAGESLPVERTRSGGGLLVIGAVIALGGLGAGVFLVGQLNQRPNAAASPTTANESEKPEESPEARTARAELDGTPEPALDTSASANASVSAEPLASNQVPAQLLPPSGPTVSHSNAPPAPNVVGDAPACRNLIALMCSKTSGATPAECSAWKGNVASWQQKFPPSVVADTCRSAFETSEKGLALRREQRSAPPP